VKNQLIEFVVDSIWLCLYPVHYAGIDFASRMSIVRLSDGSLMLHSPLMQVSLAIWKTTVTLSLMLVTWLPGDVKLKYVAQPLNSTAEGCGDVRSRVGSVAHQGSP
jgi:hypothetical protein